MALACKTCATPLDQTLTRCPGCGADAPIGKLAALTGLICPSCEAYSDPGSTACMGCGEPLGRPLEARPSPPLSPPPPPPPPPRAAPGPKAAARAPGFVRLVVERGEAPVGLVFPLAEEGEVRLGGAGSEVPFPRDPCLATWQATLSVENGAVQLRDEGAAGGVYVRLRGLSLPLRPGGLFAVGDHLLRYGGLLPPRLAPAADGTARLGSPRPPEGSALVEERLEGGIGGRAYVRPGPSITIGRSGCSINLADDIFISQNHAELLLEPDGGARLRDLGSANGTFVRLPPGSSREMRDGDRVRLGREVLRVDIGP